MTRGGLRVKLGGCCCIFGGAGVVFVSTVLVEPTTPPFGKKFKLVLKADSSFVLMMLDWSMCCARSTLEPVETLMGSLPVC